MAQTVSSPVIVITPASRPQNWTRIKEALAWRQVDWVPIVLEEHRDHPAFAEPWIHPYPVLSSDISVNPCYDKINCYLDSPFIARSAWYHILCDDSLPGPGMYGSVKAIDDADIVMIAALRGQNQTPGEYGLAHTTYPLPAHSAYCETGLCTLEQFCVKGEFFRKLRFAIDDGCADGIWASSLGRLWKSRMVFRNDIQVLFNALEPGRWEQPYLDQLENHP